MPKNEFRFIEAYRTMVPDAAREIVEARQKGHDKLYLHLKTMDKVYDLCRLAFQLPYDAASLTGWFEKIIRELDPQFSIELDKAEAGRIASLLLRDLISRGSPPAAFAVLVSSYCGRRAPIDRGELLIAASEAIAEAGRKRRIVGAEAKIAFPDGRDLKAELDAIQPNFNGASVRAALDAISTDLRDRTAKLANTANETFKSLRNDTVRLAEEVDMLWWYIGDWSEILDKPRSGLPDSAIAIVSGIEIGNFVRQIPGPYGAYGILRRSVTKISERKAKLKDVVTAIGGDDLKRLAHDLPQSAMSIFPVHAAIRLLAEPDARPSATRFQAVGRAINLEATHYELAVQAFRERVLINHGGLGQ